MLSLPQRLRYWIACYAAVVTIVLEHFAGPPALSTTQSPVPLVRINEREHPQSVWHPDELIDCRARGISVLVWDASTPEMSNHRTSRFYLN